MRGFATACCLLIAVGVLLPSSPEIRGAGLATDSGYGYDVYYSQATNLTHPSLDLESLVSNYSRGANLSVAMTTAAPAGINDRNFEYEANILDTGVSNGTTGFFGSASVVFDNASVAFVDSLCTKGSPVSAIRVPVTVSDGGRTISAPVNISWVPPQPRFQMTARASDTGGNVTCIGYDYLANCSRNSSAAGSSGSSGPSFFGLGPAQLLVLIIPILVIIVVAVVVLIRRSRRPRSPASWQLPPPRQPPGPSG